MKNPVDLIKIQINCKNYMDLTDKICLYFFSQVRNRLNFFMPVFVRDTDIVVKSIKEVLDTGSNRKIIFRLS
jgi:hypothetical protein